MSKKFTNVYYAFVDNLDVENTKEKLPKIRAEKVQNLESYKDQQLSEGVYLLLCKALEKFGINASEFEFKYDENDKPFLEGCPILFSMSHSGSCVAVAISNEPIGIDIQKLDEIDFKIRKFIFTEKDEKEYQNSEDKLMIFYEKWTRKEAQYKLDGRTFKNDNSDPCYFFKIDEKYLVAVTGEKPDEIRELNI